MRNMPLLGATVGLSIAILTVLRLFLASRSKADGAGSATGCDRQSTALGAAALPPCIVTAHGESGSIFAMTDHPLNTKGLQCPLPVLRARKAIKAIAIGDTLTVEATDPGARKDFPAFCEATGNRLLSVVEEEGILRFVIERAA